MTDGTSVKFERTAAVHLTIPGGAMLQLKLNSSPAWTFAIVALRHWPRCPGKSFIHRCENGSAPPSRRRLWSRTTSTWFERARAGLW